jgi:hypothetical protein
MEGTIHTTQIITYTIITVKTKDGNKRYQRKKERIVKVPCNTCIISFFFWLSEFVSETIILDIMKLQLLLYML